MLIQHLHRRESEAKSQGAVIAMYAEGSLHGVWDLELLEQFFEVRIHVTSVTGCHYKTCKFEPSVDDVG